jgi:hypothetical protein
MRTHVCRKIVLIEGPGDEVVLSAGEEIGFLPLVWPACESVRRSWWVPMGKGPLLGARLSKMLRFGLKAWEVGDGGERREGCAPHHHKQG